MKVYAGLFGKLNNKRKHVTLDYNPGKCQLPSNIKEDDIIQVKVIGEFNYKGFKSLQVQIDDLKTNPKGWPLHISLRWPEGRKPGEMGLLMKKNKNKVKKIKSYYIDMKAGYFET